ncbi:hypothetical protein E4T47_05655 [Aureobasidium subglaciale]|nr:hypothetical protein E4T47_05655 [Aureobasidium subglaciale]
MSSSVALTDTPDFAWWANIWMHLQGYPAGPNKSKSFNEGTSNIWQLNDQGRSICSEGPSNNVRRCKFLRKKLNKISPRPVANYDLNDLISALKTLIDHTREQANRTEEESEILEEQSRIREEARMKEVRKEAAVKGAATKKRKREDDDDEQYKLMQNIYGELADLKSKDKKNKERYESLQDNVLKVAKMEDHKDHMEWLEDMKRGKTLLKLKRQKV